MRSKFSNSEWWIFVFMGVILILAAISTVYAFSTRNDNENDCKRLDGIFVNGRLGTDICYREDGTIIKAYN